jgi:hypothetical protein
VSLEQVSSRYKRTMSPTLSFSCSCWYVCRIDSAECQCQHLYRSLPLPRRTSACTKLDMRWQSGTNLASYRPSTAAHTVSQIAESERKVAWSWYDSIQSALPQIGPGQVAPLPLSVIKTSKGRWGEGVKEGMCEMYVLKDT